MLEVGFDMGFSVMVGALSCFPNADLRWSIKLEPLIFFLELALADWGIFQGLPVATFEPQCRCGVDKKSWAFFQW